MTAKVRGRIESELSQEVRLGVRSKQKWRARTLFNKLTTEGVYKGSERYFQEIFKEIRVPQKYSLARLGTGSFPSLW